MAVSGSEDAAGVEGEYGPEDPFKICQLDHAINEFLLRYLKSADTDSRYSVLSQGRSQADVVKYGSNFIRDIMFGVSIPVYNDQSWLKHVNAI